jgi:hypothetical protein
LVQQILHLAFDVIFLSLATQGRQPLFCFWLCCTLAPRRMISLADSITLPRWAW